MNYTLNQLQIFLEVAQKQSVTKAAEALHLTQPAVSIQLKNFQDQFEIPLTEVVGRKIFITDFGREIAEAAENILNQVHAINYKAMAHKGQLTGRLKVSVVSTGKYVMPYFLSDFVNQHPGVELIMDVTNKQQVVESLEKNTVDFSLVSVMPDNLKLSRVDLMPNKIFLVGNPQRQFSRKVYKEDIFEELPLIHREPGSGTRATMEKYLERNKVPTRKTMELTSNEAVKQAVLAGLGYSIMSVVGLKNELRNGDLQIIPVKGFPIRTVWSLVWLTDKKHSPAAGAFLEFIRQEKDNIVRTKFDWIEQYGE